MVRVVFVSSYPPVHGRLSEYAYNLIDELRKNPDVSHIDVITEVAGPAARENVGDKVTVHRLYRPDDPLSILAVPLKIIALKPDIVHFNVHMAVFGRSRVANFFGLSLPAICRAMGYKTVVTLHNLFEKIDVEKTGYRNTFVNRAGSLVATKLLAMSSAVTFTMRSYVGYFARRYGCENVKMIPHGTWTRESSWSESFQKNSILYMGHSGPYKDLNLLLDAFKILVERKPDLRLIVAGNSHPNYPGFLDRFKERNNLGSIKFIGYVPEERLQGLFEEAYAVVLPYSTCTGTSGVAHLASSYGTPIVATDTPEFRELAGEGCGLLISGHTPESIAANIEEIIDDPFVAMELRRRSLVFAGERSWANVAASFCGLYGELLEVPEVAEEPYVVADGGWSEPIAVGPPMPIARLLQGIHDLVTPKNL